MKNIVTASIKFSFKGVNHNASLTLDLNDYMRTSCIFPNLYPLIAKENNFDMYSYEYEMMQSEEIVFTEPSGLVENFFTDEKLDIDAFIAAYREEKVLEKLVLITERHMLINDLSEHPELKQALLEAHQLGKQSGN